MTEKSPTSSAGKAAQTEPSSTPSARRTAGDPQPKATSEGAQVPVGPTRYPRWMVSHIYKGFAMGPPRHGIERSKKHVRPHYVWLADLPKPEPDHNPGQSGEGA